jgi:uncharacterized membrane protein
MTTQTRFAPATTLGTAWLLAALLGTGVLAGVYYAYATSVMTALGRGDDRTFVNVMNTVNTVIVNPWFMVVFLGSVGFTGLAAVAHRGPGQRAVLWWILAALALNVISFLITSGLNVPLNTRLAAEAGHGAVDWAAARARFETPWVRWNAVRTVANVASTGSLAWALVLHGRLGR